MQKLLIASLCLITFNLTGCEKPQTTKLEQATTSATATPLSKNNLADITADIAALQSLQSLQAMEHVDFRNDLLNAKNQDDQPAIKKHFAKMQDFVKKYNQELDQLALTSSEADQFRTQLKAFNQLTLQYTELELQEKPNEKALIELQNKIDKVQQELTSNYSQMEQKVSIAAKQAHK